MEWRSRDIVQWASLRRIASIHTSVIKERGYSDIKVTEDMDFRSRIAALLFDPSVPHPVGSLDPQLRGDAEKALESWSLDRSARGFENSLRILERLVWEQEYLEQQYENGSVQQETTYSVRPYLVNKVVDCWRICWGKNQVHLPPAEMLRILDEFETRGVVADSRALTMIVDAMMHRGDTFEAPLLAQWLLDRRIEQAEDDPTLRPDSFLLTSVIRAWAKSGRLEGPEMAEGILELMHDLYESGWTNSCPNAVSYAATMEAWSQSRHPEAASAVERLLNRMKNSMIETLKPDSVVYSYVINAWVYSTSPLGPQKAQSYLEEMIELYENGNDPVKPKVSHFSRVMFGCARKGDYQRAEHISKRLQKLYEQTGDPELEPDDECRKAMLVAMTKKGSISAAQGILNELIENAVAKKDPKLMPKRSYFVDLLVAMTKAKDRWVAANQSEKLLRQMVDLGRSGFPEVMPDAHSFRKVLLAWSKIQGKDAGARAEDLFHFLGELYNETGIPKLRPTAKHAEIAVLAWSRSLQQDAPDKAAVLVEGMEAAWAAGDSQMRPSRGAYTNLMQAWVRKGHPIQQNKAVVDIFDKIHSFYANGEYEYRPDLMVYSALMDSWTRIGDYSKVQAIFRQMTTDYINGNHAAKPDVQAFNKILKAISSAHDPKPEKIAEEVFISLGDYGKMCGLKLEPDAYTYSEMIYIWSSSNDDNAANKAESYLREMLQKGYKPSFSVYHTVLSAWLRKEGSASTEHASALLDEMIMAVRSKKVQPPLPKPYRKFLVAVANSCIPEKKEQAQRMLETLPEGKVIPLLLA